MNSRLQLVVIWGSLFALQAEAMAQQPRAIRIPSEATPDAPQPCLFWAPNVPEGEKRPLLVNLHTWSSDYAQDRSPWWQQAVSRSWFLIQPNFQGANDHPDAGGSELARRQVLEARDWVIENYPVDTERVYIAGVSGGGHMTMLMSGYHADQFSAASAWCGPSNLADWYTFHAKGGVNEHYAQMIAACCGGPPGASNAVEEQYLSRSPIHHLQHVGDLHLDINTGVLDGKEGSVPIHHSLRAYNVVAEANGDPLIAESEMDHLWNNGELADPQSSDLAGDREYRNPVLLRRQSGNTRVTVFDGTHEAFPETACEWLSRQHRQVVLPGEVSVEAEGSTDASCDDAVSTIDETPLHLHWADNFLTISGEHLPGGEIKVHYLEAYCRDRSTDADWVGHTYIGHSTELLEASDDGTFIKLECLVADGLRVTHEIRSTHDEVDFRIHAHNPTDQRSEAHWAQPCNRLDRFTGCDQESYLAKSFVFLDGELAMMPTRDWATEARYTPGQVWAAPGVDRRDINPRPLHPDVPSNGLIGCFSADDSMIFATAFEPYQELFQGVIVCLHSDFRLGGLEPGASRDVRGKIYIVPNDIEALLERYESDFPEHVAAE